MMIEHHQGAIEMATTEADDGEDTTARGLADDIVATQDTQVTTMQGLQGQ